MSLNPEMRSTNFQLAADHGNSVAASMSQAGGFESRPYKGPDCALPPVSHAVDRIDELLLLIRREHGIVDRTGATRCLLIDMPGDEAAVLAENLQPIVDAVRFQCGQPRATE